MYLYSKKKKIFVPITLIKHYTHNFLNICDIIQRLLTMRNGDTITYNNEIDQLSAACALIKIINIILLLNLFNDSRNLCLDSGLQQWSEIINQLQDSRKKKLTKTHHTIYII